MSNKQQPGSERRRVRISLESRNADEHTAYQMEGELYPKGHCIYLRYQEPPEAGLGRTFTTLRIEPQQLRIVRQGDVKYEQTFKAGVRQLGYIQTTHGRLELETATKSVDVRAEGVTGDTLFVGWSYELAVMGEAAGSFRVEMTAIPYETP